jgi:hypothetical protein
VRGRTGDDDDDDKGDDDEGAERGEGASRGRKWPVGVATASGGGGEAKGEGVVALSWPSDDVVGESESVSGREKEQGRVAPPFLPPPPPIASPALAPFPSAVGGDDAAAATRARTEPRSMTMMTARAVQTGTGRFEAVRMRARRRSQEKKTKNGRVARRRRP